VLHARLLHGSAPNKSDRIRLILFYECRAADAWPLLGSGFYLKHLKDGRKALWEEIEASVITG
jgi:hypothetical protein